MENLTLTGTAAINGIGNALKNVLVGNKGVNTLGGGDGNDKLQGGLGNDILTGGAGQDIFQLKNLSKDTLTDFSVAADANDHVIYNSGTGALFYDADGNGNGNGNGAAIQIAGLSPGMALTNVGFFVI